MNLPFNISIQVAIFVVAFILSVIAGPFFIPILRRLKFGQTVRDDGPQSHLKKTGTPTMGGVIFMLPVLVVSIFYARYDYRILPIALVTVGFGIIGFLDDFIKVVKKRKDGLYAHQKMFGLILIATSFVFYAVKFTDLGTDIIIPFMGIDSTLSLPVGLFVFFTIFFLLATTNGVNMTDGLDGLAAGVTLIIMVFMTIVAMTRSEWDYIKVFSATVAGGCLGFMVFNTHPAKVFMGDTGSLALGGAVGAVAVMMKIPLLIIIIGIIYLAETLSVMIQVGSFKLRGKRVFKMAPLHHHFELSGWKETKIVYVFWTVTVIFCIIGFLALRFRFY